MLSFRSEPSSASRAGVVVQVGAELASPGVGSSWGRSRAWVPGSGSSSEGCSELIVRPCVGSNQSARSVPVVPARSEARVGHSWRSGWSCLMPGVAVVVMVVSSPCGIGLVDALRAPRGQLASRKAASQGARLLSSKSAMMGRAPTRLSRPGLLDRPITGGRRGALDAADPPRRPRRPHAVRGVPNEARDCLQRVDQPAQAAMRRGAARRVPDPERPGRPKYVLNDKGRELAPALIVLMKWGDRHYPAPGGPPRLTLHASCGGNLGPDLRCDRCGKHAARGEIELPPGPGAPRGEHAGQ